MNGIEQLLASSGHLRSTHHTGASSSTENTFELAAHLEGAAVDDTNDLTPAFSLPWPWKKKPEVPGTPPKEAGFIATVIIFSIGFGAGYLTHASKAAITPIVVRTLTGKIG